MEIHRTIPSQPPAVRLPPTELTLRAVLTECRTALGEPRGELRSARFQRACGMFIEILDFDRQVGAPYDAVLHFLSRTISENWRGFDEWYTSRTVGAIAMLEVRIAEIEKRQIRTMYR